MFPFRAHCNIYILSRKKSVCDFLFVFVCLFCFVLFCVSFFKNSLVFFLTSATSVRLRERKEFEKQCFFLSQVCSPATIIGVNYINSLRIFCLLV